MGVAVLLLPEVVGVAVLPRSSLVGVAVLITSPFLLPFGEAGIDHKVNKGKVRWSDSTSRIARLNSGSGFLR